MGLIGTILGGQAGAIGGAVRDVAEVFTPSATRQMELSAAAQNAALSEMASEFAGAGRGWFDSFVNGLNRLPRPCLALGTVGLFVYAMVDPVGFSQRMIGLSAVPEPLWWLLGAVVAFYFGARESHYFRASLGAKPVAQAKQAIQDNAALQDWQAQ